MKNAVFLLTLLCLFFSCKIDHEARHKIKAAEELLLAENPDSAFVLLKDIANPDALDNKTFAHWCLMYADVCEQLEEDMPFVSQMERATEYYESHGTAEEKIRCRMHLGQTYEDEKYLDEAMFTYLQAVDFAKSKQQYLLSGKIYNKIAQLYKFEDDYDEAQRFYQLSGECYLKGKDSLNYVYSVRDIGWIYTLKEEYGHASEFLEKAYQSALSLNDSLLLSSMTNRLGNNYLEMGNYSLAEKYLFQSVSYDEAGSAPTYLALANLYMLEKQYEKARYYIKEAVQHQTSNRMFTGGILYQLYALEKGLGNYPLSLGYYEQYTHFLDSISDLQLTANVLKVEKRYKYERLLNENNQLELEIQWWVMGCFCLIIICLFLLGLYKYRILLKNKYIYQQEKIIKDKHVSLLEKEFAVKGLSNEISKIRENIMVSSKIYKKIIENSQSVEKAKKYPLTDRDWLALKEIVKSTYISFFENLNNCFPKLTEEEIRFSCLLKIGLDSQQLSILLDIQPTSVTHKRYRIMKKGGLENTNTTLEKVIANL